MDPQQIASRLRALTASFNAAQLASLALAFVLVVGIIVGSAWWMSTPTYALLFSDMDPETASSIVSRLKTLKVSYQLDDGGRAIRVPIDRVDELRLELTAQGLPASGRVGFELFDRTAFGATQFLEQVNYRRALEGEIARTIATLSEVASARVHIAMGKETLFGEPRPAKASIVLKLRGQQTLSPATIAGIGNLVAASVEGLRPDAVVILDSFGRPLLRPSGDDIDYAGGAQQLERQQRLERDMAARVVALLEPVVGPDRVRVNVALRLNPATVQQTEERWDPNTVVRSRQVTSDTTSSNGAGGLAGARANMPPPADPKNPAPPAQPEVLTASTGTSRTAETTNYEVGRTTVVTERPPGEIARLSVAVIVDDQQVVTRGEDGTSQVTRKPRSPEELQQIQGLVAAAVGLESERGDQVTVQNISFDEPLFEELPPPTTLERVQQYAPQIWEGVRVLGIIVIGALALLFFVRPLMQRLGGASSGGRNAPAGALPGGPDQPLRTVADLESEIEAQLEASATPKADSRRLPVLARRVSGMTTSEPENAAKLLRAWIHEGER